MIYTFNNNFIKSLKDKYSFNGNSQILNNPRYYVSGIRINNKDLFMCVPLHSNGKYIVKIKNPKSSSYSNHWKNHGLNFEKILLLTKEEFMIYNEGIFNIDNNVFNDIEQKEDVIKEQGLIYLNKYINAYKKRKENKYLTREEKNILNYSSLNSFEDKVEMLLNVDIKKLTLIDMDKIDLIELAQEEEYLNKLRNSISIAEYAHDVLGLDVLKETGGMFRIETEEVYQIYPNNTFGRLSKSIGGDVICFVKHFHNVETEEAIKILEKHYYETTPEVRFNVGLKL